jgi:hypothetical protein
MILLTHIKISRNNVYIIASNVQGKILYIKTAGQFGYKHKNKIGLDSFKVIILNVLKLILNYKFSCIFFVLVSVNKKIMYLIFKQLLLLFSKYNITVLYFKVNNLIAHNGCRNKLD